MRKKILTITRDCSRLLSILNAPIVSLIQDSINGQVNMRALGVTGFYLKELMKLNDVQTQAFITSNGINRYSAYRIDMQAYYISTIFAAITLFISYPQTPGELAVKAIGF